MSDKVNIPMTQDQLYECMTALEMFVNDRCNANEAVFPMQIYEYLSKFRNESGNENE